MNIKPWLKAVRVRFLLASIISVSIGLAVALWKGYAIDIAYALLTYAGVIALHASVDLLNDYWDYRLGVDKATRRTPFSGGTGVLPENILKPESVYKVGLIMLVIGAIIGLYFVAVRGFMIAVILAFAVVSVYLYSTNIVRVGLGELFVAVKGAMIVLGTYYVQTAEVSIEPLYVGVIAGVLSSTVLFMNSFPDYNADKASGRRTLVIALGLERASRVFIAFPILAYILIIVGVLSSIMPIYILLSFVALPYALHAYRTLLKEYNNSDVERLIPSMSSTVIFSRVTGIIIALGFLVATIFR